MRSFSFFPALLVVSGLACAPEEKEPKPEIDTSCGIDCAAQKAYGLLPNTCFEYSTSASDPGLHPVLGIRISPAKQVDGKTAIVAEYRMGGLVKREDSFDIREGALYLLKRVSGHKSVAFQDDAQKLVGIKWLRPEVLTGDTLITEAQAYRNAQGEESSTLPVTIEVSVLAPSEGELNTPMQNFDEGFRLDFQGASDALDVQRVWVKDVGFVSLNTAMSDGGSPESYYLSGVRTLAEGDYACGS